MSDKLNPQGQNQLDNLTLKQFRANFKEIFDAETTFGSSRAGRMELLEGVKDLIQEYLKNGSRLVYLHGRLKEAGYTGSRKELSEWLVEKGLWRKREVSKKKAGSEKNVNTENSQDVSSSSENAPNKDGEIEHPASTNDNTNNVPSPPTFSPGAQSKHPTLKIEHQPSVINKNPSVGQK